MKTWARHSLAFLDSERSGGIILLLCTTVSLILANGVSSESYRLLWHTEIASRPIEFWINDGLMAIFFLQVGLEIEREIYLGELSDIRKSMLPVLAAIGGMLVPAIIHFAFNINSPTQNGFGIPMATDIAFSLGILSLLGKRIPLSLKLFLTALAIIDDLGAVLVIALFYSSHISILYLVLALLIFAFLILLNRIKLLSLWIYLLLGCVMWFFMLQSGIHPTISGVMLAFAIPLGSGDSESPSSILQHWLHKPVAFFILPLFALANTAIVIPSSLMSELTTSNSLGIILGLVIGKPTGIFLFAWIGLTLGWCLLPHTLKLAQIFSVGLIAGIGFTMSIFISLLAFNERLVAESSKIAVLVGSVISGAVGILCLILMFKKK